MFLGGSGAVVVVGGGGHLVEVFMGSSPKKILCYFQIILEYYHCSVV